MFRAAYRSSPGALTLFAANTVRAPDDERHAARNMFSLQ